MVRASEVWNKQWKSERKYKERHRYSYSFRRIKEEIKKRLKKEEIKVCEFGCGGGEWLLWIKNEYDAQIYGVDRSKRGLEIAKSKVGGDLRYEDIRKTSFKSNSFDFVFGIGLLEHFPKEEIIKILNEQKRVLKPGGVVMNTLPNLSKFSLLWISRIFKKRDERTIERGELMGECLSAGLKDIEIIPCGLFIPKLRNKRWFSRLNLRFLENFKTSDNIVAFARKW